MGEKPRPGAPARTTPLQPGVLMIEMPAQKPDAPPPPKIKGVVGPTRDAEYDDYEPGSGRWSPYLGNHYAPGTGEPNG